MSAAQRIKSIAGQNIPFWVSALTIMATAIGSAAVITHRVNEIEIRLDKVEEIHHQVVEMRVDIQWIRREMDR